MTGTGCATDNPSAPDPGFTGVDLSAPWTSADPAELGFDVPLLEEALATASEIPRLTSIVVAREGRIVVERYHLGRSAESLHDVRGVTGVVISALVGLALERGELPSVDRPAEEFLAPEWTLTGLQRSITLRHLLTMSSGFEWDGPLGESYVRWLFAGDPVGTLLGTPHAEEPGATFRRNAAAVHLLGEILRRVTDRELPSYAREHLFRPAGIDTVRWEMIPGGFTNFGSGIELRTRDLLRLGQLVLQRGRSGDRTVLPPRWTRETVERQVPWRGARFGPLEDLTFGYLWWSDEGPVRNVHIAWGFGGQFIVVVPDRRLVAVTTTEWRRLRQIPTGVEVLESAILDLVVNGIVASAR